MEEALLSVKLNKSSSFVEDSRCCEKVLCLSGCKVQVVEIFDLLDPQSCSTGDHDLGTVFVVGSKWSYLYCLFPLLWLHLDLPCFFSCIPFFIAVALATAVLTPKVCLYFDQKRNKRHSSFLLRKTGRKVGGFKHLRFKRSLFHSFGGWIQV